jgi:hypothetical protein
LIPDDVTFLTDFLVWARQRDVSLSPGDLIRHRASTAPHVATPLENGTCAVYVFSLSTSAGAQCPAGPNRALKVGSAGCRSNARFQYQHYNPRSARSTLAAMILNAPYHWKFLGIERLDESTVGEWIKTHTDRDDYFLSATHEPLLLDLERFIRGRLGPLFEG